MGFRQTEDAPHYETCEIECLDATGPATGTATQQCYASREGQKSVKKAGAAAGFLAVAVLTAGAVCRCAPVRSRAEIQDQVEKKLNLANLYMEAQKYPQAVAIITELAKQSPKDPEIQFNLGVAQFGAHDYPASEAALEEALRLDPRKSEAYNYLGAIYFSLGEQQKERGDANASSEHYREAIEAYRKALANPAFTNREQVYLSLSDAHDAMGNSEEAIRAAREAIERNPHYSPAHFKVAVLLDRLERTREAIEEYEIAAPGYSSDPNYHYRLGVAYFRDNKPELAREHLSMVAAAIPGTEKARKAKEFLDLIAAPAPPRAGSQAVRP